MLQSNYHKHTRSRSQKKRNDSLHGGGLRTRSTSRDRPKSRKRQVHFIKRKRTRWHARSTNLNSVQASHQSFPQPYRPDDEVVPASQYVQFVKDSLSKEPQRYQRFMQIIDDLQYDQSDLISSVDEVIRLFDKYPGLIKGFTAFLPKDYELEVQDSAVIIHHYDDAADNIPRGNKTADPALDYIKQVKRVLRGNEAAYHEFNKAMKDFHSNHQTDIMTVRRIVKILFIYPELVLGFQYFLPDQFCIHMFQKEQYVLHYPNNEGNMETCTITIDN